MDESDLLRAVQEAPHDDQVRLVYADWLEERGDPRAEYLRLQCELKRSWSYARPCRDIYSRMKELRRGLDPHWLQCVRRCTTPTPPADVAAAVRGLKRLAKTTVVLHPRPGTAAPDASKIGGTFLWPAGESWPACPEHGCPLVAALQLRKEDVPELRFRRGTDLFQLLWCPNDHEPHFCPQVEVYWRRQASIRQPGATHPTPTRAEQWYVPRPCLLYPERVVEYPDPFELEDDLLGQLDKAPELAQALELVRKMRVRSWHLPGDIDGLYQYWLSTADGTKVGGYPDWVQSPQYPDCSCGTRMELLVMFSSWEFDGATWGRWLPVEERDVLSAGYRARQLVQSPAGWMFGDAGNLYVFACPSCKDRPVRTSMQCS